MTSSPPRFTSPTNGLTGLKNSEARRVGSVEGTAVSSAAVAVDPSNTTQPQTTAFRALDDDISSNLDRSDLDGGVGRTVAVVSMG